MDVDGESLLLGIGDIAVSSGSACQSSTGKPSHVLAAMMGADAVPSASIRFGIGRFTTEADIDAVIDKFTTVVRKLRELAPAH
jgi:cysteine desulfurase